MMQTRKKDILMAMLLTIGMHSDVLLAQEMGVQRMRLHDCMEYAVSNATQMGVFGIVLFKTQHRQREIAIRRVLGAEVQDVLDMINRRFAVIVILSYAVASPVSWIIIDQYLSTFDYRTPVGIWLFVTVLILVLILTLGIVTLRSLQSAKQNPIENLKSE